MKHLSACPVMAGVLVSMLLVGCNNVDRSDTKGVDSTPDAQNTRNPKPMKDPDAQAASAAQGQPKAPN